MEEYDQENTTGGHGCGCECLISSFIWPRNKSKTIKHGWILLTRQEVTIKDGWVEKRAKKVKEISKVLTAWKWKNLVHRKTWHLWNQQEERAKFHYDAQSYALNFDNGENRESDGTRGEVWSSRSLEG